MTFSDLYKLYPPELVNTTDNIYVYVYLHALLMLTIQTAFFTPARKPRPTTES